MTLEPIKVGFVLSGPLDTGVPGMSGFVWSTADGREYLGGLQNHLHHVLITLILCGQLWIDIKNEDVH